MKRLIINADDFGLCHGVNLGILHGYREGVVSSTTLMVSMPGAVEAFALARQHPGLGVGLHVVLTAGRPLARGVQSLTGPDGRFLRSAQLIERAQPDHLALEVQAQVEAFLSSGLRPTHLDSHHHIHRQIPAVADAMREAAAKLSIPIREFDAGFFDGFYGKEQVGVEHLLSMLGSLREGQSEIMCHPGYVDPALLELSSYTLERVLELRTLTDPRVRQALEAGRIQLVNFSQIA